MSRRVSYCSKMGDEIAAAIVEVLERHRAELKRRRLRFDLIGYWVGFYAIEKAITAFRATWLARK